MAKRANFHIGIAYYIHMNEMKKRGENMSNIELIDPTRQSREIKQRDQISKKSIRNK